MPILWRYLCKNYFQFLFLCISAFVAVLLVIRFQEIALFASAGASLSSIGLFALYQIPYILPIAIPISCLIASLILFQRMSSSLELTSLRACGISLAEISTPLVLCASLLCVCNFSIISEMTPTTRTKAKNLIYKTLNENPLAIMQRDSILNLKCIEFDLKTFSPGKEAQEVLAIFRSESSDRISILTAKKISTDKENLITDDLSIISGMAPNQTGGYDHLAIENQKQMQTPKQGILNYVFKTEWFKKEDLLNLQGLIEKIRTEHQSFPSKLHTELLRRICLGLCPLTFTFIGIAFGIDVGRNRKKILLFLACFCAALVMVSFVAAKTLSKSPALALWFYLLPQPIAALIGWKFLRRACRGIA